MSNVRSLRVSAPPAEGTNTATGFAQGSVVSVVDRRGIVRFGRLHSAVDESGPFPTVEVVISGQVKQVAARDVEAWPPPEAGVPCRARRVRHAYRQRRRAS